MYHCDIISEIILTYLTLILLFFREAIEPFVLWFYIWGVLFSGIVLPHRVLEIAAVKGSLVPLPDFFESISALVLLFF